MSRILITGSADGLGQLAARELIAQGHQVVLHARNAERAAQALQALPGAKDVLTADLSSISETVSLAQKANALGRFDAVIHNAGVYNAPAETLFAVNTLAPYILSCLMQKPERLVYLSSDMHESGHAKLDCFESEVSRINYSDTKLHVLLLCKAIARKWPHVYANAVHPGWVPTKMGGSGAPDSLEGGYRTQVWLAASTAGQAMVSGRYFFHKKEKPNNPLADDVELQDRFIESCRKITGISLNGENA